ncbi:MAG TPA: DEAD/DEAH box helicase [Actinocrinis sp.]|nr:DEAD/DEAH box helicase [Actinocrinis sp.]
MLPETVEALDSLGITRPFPIQSATIPVALSGSDVIGQAKTGTGKTLAFGIPVLQRVTGLSADTAQPAEAAADPADEAAPAAGPAPKGGRGRSRGRGRSSGPANALAPAHGAPEALVVVPTRELAIQVAGDLAAAGKVRAVRVHALYGGRAYEPQVEALRAGIDVAVGTPGRLLDLCQQKHLDLSRVRILILDEADEMLDLGFLPDVERIIDQLPAQRQTMLFSATMPGQVISLARRYMTKPTHIRAADPDDHGTQVRNISQFVYRAHSMDKIELLSRVLQADGRGLAMVFARTKRTVAKVAEELAARHFAVAAVHGDLGQGAREQALRAFRNGKVDVLVATDVAARGIDVEGVTHVVNFQCPEDEKVYTHRIGRTGRAGNKGTAVTLVDWDEVPKWNLINKTLDLSFPDPPETYSTSPQLFADLGIATGSKGVLPKVERTRAGLAAEELEDLGETGRSRSARSAAPPRADRPGAAPAERPAARAERSAADAPRAERTPRQRTRNRTRGGVSLPAGAAVQSPDEPVAVEVPIGENESVVTVVAAAGTPVEPAAPAEPTRSRRARSRSGKPAAGAATAATSGSASSAGPRSAEPSGSDPYKLAPGSLAPGSLSDSLFESAAPAKAPAARTRAAQPRAALNDPFKLAPGSLSDPRFTPAAEPTAPAAPAELAAAAAEAPAERKRSRSRKKAEPAAPLAADETAVTAAVDTVPELELDAAPAAPARKRSRARKTTEAAVETATATVVAEVAEPVDAADADATAPAARKRTRARKTTEAEPPAADLVIPAQPTAEQVGGDLVAAGSDAPAKAPRRRTAKKAVAAEENPARVNANVSGAEPTGEPEQSGPADHSDAEAEAHGGGVANPRRTRV